VSSPLPLSVGPPDQLHPPELDPELDPELEPELELELPLLLPLLLLLLPLLLPLLPLLLLPPLPLLLPLPLLPLLLPLLPVPLLLPLEEPPESSPGRGAPSDASSAASFWLASKTPTSPLGAAPPQATTSDAARTACNFLPIVIRCLLRLLSLRDQPAGHRSDTSRNRELLTP
jgi:hypothetical protein